MKPHRSAERATGVAFPSPAAESVQRTCLSGVDRVAHQQRRLQWRHESLRGIEPEGRTGLIEAECAETASTEETVCTGVGLLPLPGLAPDWRLLLTAVCRGFGASDSRSTSGQVEFSSRYFDCGGETIAPGVSDAAASCHLSQRGARALSANDGLFFRRSGAKIDSRWQPTGPHSFPHRHLYSRAGSSTSSRVSIRSCL